MATKKLIEVALPLEKINAAAGREKSIRHGHPSTLHLWWARRPLAAARAVIWASLVDDPSSHPELYPSDEEQNRERERLFGILESLVVWENSNDENVLSAAREEIMKSTNNNPPALLDPFAGGGAIPLEAQRLGLKAYAHDLNPVAITINKAMIEIPPRFIGCSPVNDDVRNDNTFVKTKWDNAAGLAEDVRFYGEWLKSEAYKRIGHLYPSAELPKAFGGGKATVFTWIWARTVKCPNPACGCEMPLVGSYELTIKKGKEAWMKPIPNNGKIDFSIQYGKCPKEYKEFKSGHAAVFKCPACGESTTDQYVKNQGKKGGIHSQLFATIAEGKNGRVYLEPTVEHILAADVDVPENIPSGSMPENPRWFSPPAFGMEDYADLFTNRQLVMFSTFSDLLGEVRKKIESDAITSGMADDHIKLRDGGNGAKAYSEAISVYLSFVIDKMLDYHSTLTSWHMTRESIANALRRQALPMVWDYTEVNPFCNSAGSFSNMLDRIITNLSHFKSQIAGEVKQHDAQSDCGLRDIMVSTDPPYYDNIGYADLSDYFYIWLRRNLRDVYPELFSTMLVPKAEELVATPYHFGGSADKAKEFFEDGMLATCKQIYKYSRDDLPVTIYYAYKQSDSGKDKDNKKQASTGWETMLSSIITAGFAITGTWPMRTELTTALKGHINALSSSIVLVCRKRETNASVCTRRNFINELKRELRSALKKLQISNIAPVDLAQSAIGPGMGIYSKYAQVLEADGTPMTVRSALQIINQELDLYFNEQDGELDTESRFCVDLYSQMAFNEMPFGDANTLATAKNTSVAIMASHGTLYAQKGKVHLIERPDLPTSINEHEGSIWLLCQQLTYKMEKEGIEGCAAAIANMYGSNAERAKDLAYRLYTIAERKKWAQEAYAYNALVVAWPEIQSRAAELKAIVPQQLTLEDFMNNNN